jgi:small GTP-binding protein
MDIKTDYIIKTIFIGNSRVGKTSLINKIINNNIVTEEPTYGVNYFIDRKTILNKNIKNQIWDLSGGEQFNQIVKTYYKQIDICVLVFDLTDVNSYTKLSIWLEDFNINSNNKSCVKILLGNKTDLILRRMIKKADAELFAQENKMIYIETNTKSNENLSNILNSSIHEIIRKKIYDEKYSIYSTNNINDSVYYNGSDTLLDGKEPDNSGCSGCLCEFLNCFTNK